MLRLLQKNRRSATVMPNLNEVLQQLLYPLSSTTRQRKPDSQPAEAIGGAVEPPETSEDRCLSTPRCAYRALLTEAHPDVSRPAGWSRQ